jgi:proteasome lid subunit RPN8/RPN11
MQSNIVRVRKTQADYFRRIALREVRKSGREVQAYLIGQVVSPNLTVIDEFRFPKKYAVQTTGEVQWFADEYEVVQRAAEASGKRIVGDAHSHPAWDSVLSPSDYKAHIKEGHRIAGICSVQNGRTRLRFWVVESALPLSVEYV